MSVLELHVGRRDVWVSTFCGEDLEDRYPSESMELQNHRRLLGVRPLRDLRESYVNKTSFCLRERRPDSSPTSNHNSVR